MFKTRLMLPRINLLPWREMARQRQRRGFLYQLAFSVLAGLLLSGLASLWVWQQGQARDVEVGHMAMENARLSGEVKSLAEEQKQLEALRAHAATIDQLAQQQNQGPELIAALRRHMPNDAWLVSLKLSGDQAEIEAAARNPRSAWHLARALEQEVGVAAVKLQQLQAEDGATTPQSAIRFRIGLRLRGYAPLVQAPASTAL